VRTIEDVIPQSLSHMHAVLRATHTYVAIRLSSRGDLQADVLPIRGDKLCALNTINMKELGKAYYDNVGRDEYGVAINETHKQRERLK